MRLLCVLGIALVTCACRSSGTGPYAPATESERSTVEAERLNREAADLLKSDPERAEELLRTALTKDLFYGPAHNNLGVVFLSQDKLYEAASEFEWAKKLLPESPDPRINLALVLERAGRVDEALRTYEAALEIAPESVAAMQGAACLALRSGLGDERVAGWLREIAMRAEDAGWREWAAERQSHR